MRVKLHTTDLGIPNCWFNVNNRHATIYDLISTLREEFDFPEIQLEMDGFLLLEKSTTDLLRENDLINVLPKARKRVQLDHVKQNDEEQKTIVSSIGNISKDKSVEVSSDSSSDTSSDSSSGASSDSSKEDSESDSGRESSSDSSSESGEAGSSVESEEKLAQNQTVPPIMTYFMTPPMSLVGKNKRKIVPKMLEQERVHVHFDDLDVDKNQDIEMLDQKDDNVVFSTVRLYDDEPKKEVLSASQKRRLRRKKAEIYKTLESLHAVDDTNDVQIQASANGYENIPNVSSISQLKNGMKVVYQILIMSQSYQPEISSYREALVVMVDTMKKVVTLKNTGTQEENNINQKNDEVPLRKFELPPDDDYTPETTHDELLLIHFNDLISIKMLE